jgi:bla regulator protein blaR1
VILNHLWQSTWFALGSALLSIAFRKNRAQVRYWLWFGASLKFLIPFSLLMTIGNQIEWRAAPAMVQPHMFAVMDEISEPFASTAPTPLMAAVPQQSSRVPVLLFTVWICGLQRAY